MINREILRALRADMDAALAAVATKHGLKSLTAGHCTFTESSCVFKVEGVAVGGESPDARRFRDNAHSIGCFPDDLGREIAINRTRFTVSGMGSGGAIFIARIPDGKIFRFRGDLKRTLGHADAPSTAWTVDAWIHPEAGGDDRRVVWTYPTQPTDADVVARLRRAGSAVSAVLNDYLIRDPDGKTMPKVTLAKAPKVPAPKAPAAPAPDLDALYILASDAAKQPIDALQTKYGHLNPGMQKMQLTALVRKHTKEAA